MDDNLKLTELQMHSIITVFFDKKKIYIFRAALNTNLILQKKKTYYQNVQKGCLIPISKILEI